MARTPSTEDVYEGDGTTSVFQFHFPFLHESDVFVSVDGVNVTFTLLPGSIAQVQTTVPPAAGTVVKVYRSTLAFVPEHLFAGGVPFLPRYVDENNRQLLYASQEAINDTAVTAAEALVVAEEAKEIAQSAEDKVDNAIIDSAYQLRLDLANRADPYFGTALVGRGPLILNSYAEAAATPGRFAGDIAVILGYEVGDRKGAHILRDWRTGTAPTIGTGGVFIPSTGGYWEARTNRHGEIDGEVYGLPLGSGANSYAKLEALMQYCTAHAVSAYLGDGPSNSLPSVSVPIYDTKNESFPLSGPRVPGQALVAFNFYIRSNPRVTFQTTSDSGADVFNLCCMTDFKLLGFPTIKGYLNTLTGSGSNAVSMVFGGERIVIEANPTNMPMIWVSGGGTDGGHGFTIQTGAGNIHRYADIVFRGRVTNCTSGFDLSTDPTSSVANPLVGVDISGLFIEDCYRGVVTGNAAPTSSLVADSVEKPVCGVVGTGVSIVNCQYGLIDSRSWGVNLDVTITNTKDKAALVKNPNNSTVVLVWVNGSKRGAIRVKAKARTVDTVLLCGAITMGGLDYPSVSDFLLDMEVSYTSATTEIDPGDTSSPPLRNSRVYLTGFRNVPAFFRTGSVGSTISINGRELTPTLFPGDETVQAPGGRTCRVVYRVTITGTKSVNMPANANPGDEVEVIRLAGTGSGTLAVTGLGNVAAGSKVRGIYNGTSWDLIP